MAWEKVIPTEEDKMQEALDSYLESNGTICLYCGEDQLEGHEIDIEKGIALQQVKCLSCDKSWTDIYRLIGIRGDVPI